MKYFFLGIIFAATTFSSGAAYARCGSGFIADILCNAGAIDEALADAIDRAHGDIGKAIQSTNQNIGDILDKNASLLPVRAFVKSDDIPPIGYGAYGIVALQSKVTEANRLKLQMVCKSFIATFPKDTLVSSEIPLSDRMITLWPIYKPASDKAKNDDCDFALEDYDLAPSELAMNDARLQGGKFDGEGPYLIGWSPASSRGQKDNLVLIIDLSAANSQGEIDRLFLYWKQKVVEDPAAWRGGFSLERIRASIKNFADTYGPSILDAIKIVSAK